MRHHREERVDSDCSSSESDVNGNSKADGNHNQKSYRNPIENVENKVKNMRLATKEQSKQQYSNTSETSAIGRHHKQYNQLMDVLMDCENNTIVIDSDDDDDEVEDSSNVNGKATESYYGNDKGAKENQCDVTIDIFGSDNEDEPNDPDEPEIIEVDNSNDEDSNSGDDQQNQKYQTAKNNVKKDSRPANHKKNDKDHTAEQDAKQLMKEIEDASTIRPQRK